MCVYAYKCIFIYLVLVYIFNFFSTSGQYKGVAGEINLPLSLSIHGFVLTFQMSRRSECRSRGRRVTF